MRENIGVLWVDDTKEYYDEAKEILEMYALDKGIKINFEYVQNAELLLNKLELQEEGFQIFDICFIDYALSLPSNETGDSIIKKLRQNKIGTDILFYSSENLSTIRDIIQRDISSYEGVYVANRDNFDEKSSQLLDKNAKKLYSINNIRGLLMNETSENDYIMKSYILKKYNALNDEQKTEISEYIKETILSKITKLSSQCEKIIKKIEQNKIIDANKILNIANDLLDLKEKYMVFEKITTYNSECISGNCTLDNYLSKLVALRNQLAHRKLEICNTCQYVLHYNDIEDYEEKHCCLQCTNGCEHLQNNKVCLEDWDTLKKDLIEFGDSMDNLMKTI